MFEKFWGVALVLLPLFINLRSDMPAPNFAQSWAFCALALLSVFLFGIKRTGLISSAVFVYLLAASFLFMPKNPTILGFHTWFYFCIGLVLFFQFLGSKFDFNIILKFMGVSCLICCAWVFINALGGNPWVWMIGNVVRLSGGGEIAQEQRIIGPLENPTISACYIALSSLGLFSLPYLLIIPAIALLLLKSSGAMVVFIVGIIFYFGQKYLMKKTAPILGVIGLIVTAIALIKDAGAQERILIWKNTLKMFWDLDFINKIFGSGFGFFGINYTQAFRPTVFVDHPHNEFLSALVNFGIIGFLLLFSIFSLSFKNSNPKPKAGIAMVVLSFFTMFPLHIAPIALITILIVVSSIKENRSIYGV